MHPVTFRLANGIHISWLPVHTTRLAFCGFIFNSGSRDELENESGLAHFTEHMLFKGTKKRKALDILNCLDSVGGELDAFTTREKTCYYAAVTSEYFEQAFELLFDITFNSTFPQKEINKEKYVILDEIEMYLDNPEEIILEEFDKLMFPGHVLGTPVLGEKEQILAYKTADFKRFCARNYQPEKLAISIAGNVPEETLKKVQERWLGELPAMAFDSRKLEPVTFPEPTQLKFDRKIYQANLVIGGPAVEMFHPMYFPLVLLIYELGGPTLNNRLNLVIREEHGLTYNLYSFYNSYLDNGIWGVYAGCERKNAGKVTELILFELEKIGKTDWTQSRLDALKKQYIGHVTLAWENLSSRMLNFGKDLLDFEKPWTYDMIISEIQKVQVAEMTETARYLLSPDKSSSILFNPAI